MGTEALRTLWDELVAERPGEREFRARRLANAGAAVVYAGLREADGAKSIICECPLQPPPPRASSFHGEGVSISEDRHLADDVYRVVVTAEHPAYNDVFEAICRDLIERAAPAGDARDAVRIVCRQLAHWIVALRRSEVGLAVQEATGLFGELVVLELLLEQIGEGAVVTWVGPDGGLHDFAGRMNALEVKTMVGAGASIWINSLDQLDERGLESLSLAVVRLRHDTAGTGLGAQIARLRGLLATATPWVIGDFERKLLSVGWTGDERTDADGYRVLAIEIFDVAGEFPRITRADVAPQVSEARYLVAMDSLQHLRLSPDDVPQKLQSLGKP